MISLQFYIEILHPASKLNFSNNYDGSKKAANDYTSIEMYFPAFKEIIFG